MVKLDVRLLRFLENDDFLTLAAIEKGMQKHMLVPIGEVVFIARLRRSSTERRIRDLQKNNLLTNDKGTRSDMFNLTISGYDYLALNSLRLRDAVDAFGNQITVGKGSNIYIVSAREQERCLKVHRTGLLHNHHKRRRSTSWLNLSARSATKEFACMKVLHDRHFLVPEPYDLSRHCVVMELIKGTLLHHVQELNNVKAVYDKLMNNIMRFALFGVIHGNFNEFNIILTHYERPVVIDFSHMIFIHHSSAKMYFERDVNSVINFFKKRFGYESKSFPQFSDIERLDTMDMEVNRIGLKEEMAECIEAAKLQLANEYFNSDGKTADQSYQESLRPADEFLQDFDAGFFEESEVELE